MFFGDASMKIGNSKLEILQDITLKHRSAGTSHCSWRTVSIGYWSILIDTEVLFLIKTNVVGRWSLRTQYICHREGGAGLPDSSITHLMSVLVFSKKNRRDAFSFYSKNQEMGSYRPY